MPQFSSLVLSFYVGAYTFSMLGRHAEERLYLPAGTSATSVAAAYCQRHRQTSPIGRHLDSERNDLICIEQLKLSLRAASAAACGSDSAPGFLWRADIGIDNAGEDYRVATFRFCAGQCPSDAAQYFCEQNMHADGQAECATQLAQAATAAAAAESIDSTNNPLASCDDPMGLVQTAAPETGAEETAVDVNSSNDAPKLTREVLSDRTRPQEPVAAQPSVQFGAMPSESNVAQGFKASTEGTPGSSRRFSSDDYGISKSNNDGGTFGWRDGALLFGRLCGFLSPLFIYLVYLAQRIVSGSSLATASQTKAAGRALYPTSRSENNEEEVENKEEEEVDEDLIEAAGEKVMPSPSSALKAMLAESSAEVSPSSANSSKDAPPVSISSNGEVDCASLEADLAAAETAPVETSDGSQISREMPDAALLGASVRRLRIVVAEAEARASKAEASVNDAEHALSKASEAVATANAVNAKLEQRCKDAEAEVVALRNGLHAQVGAAAEAHALAMKQQQEQHRELEGKLGLEVARWQQRAVLAEAALQAMREKASNLKVEEHSNNSPSHHASSRSPEKSSPSNDNHSKSKNKSSSKPHNTIKSPPQSTVTRATISAANASSHSAAGKGQSRKTLTQREFDSSWAANVPTSPAAAGWSPEDDINASIVNHVVEKEGERGSNRVVDGGIDDSGKVIVGHGSEELLEGTDESALDGSTRFGKAKLSARRRKAAKAKAANDATLVVSSNNAIAAVSSQAAQPVVPGGLSDALSEAPADVAPITTPPGLASVKSRVSASSLPPPIDTFAPDRPHRDVVRDPISRQKWGDAAVAMTPEPSPSHREQVLRNMTEASALLEVATAPQGIAPISTLTATQTAIQAVTDTNGVRLEESQNFKPVDADATKESSSADVTDIAGYKMADSREIKATAHTPEDLNNASNEVSMVGKETCNDETNLPSVNSSGSHFGTHRNKAATAEDGACKVESSTDELAAHLQEVEEFDQRMSPLSGGTSAMEIIGHTQGDSPDDMQYEVRWSAPGEVTEDFWFERCELLSGGLGEALSAYDQAHGLGTFGQEPKI